MHYMKSYFTTSERQFEFKENVGCSSAIYCLRKTVDHFTSNESTVNICALNLAKAFDRVNFDILFVKLMEKTFQDGS